jgi:small subunit ribosomal protein S17
MEIKTKNTLMVKYLNNSGDKTIRVIYETKKMHKQYKKFIKKSKKYLVHFDSTDKLLVGDTLLIQFTRPISKNKSYKYLKTVKKVQS